MDDVARRVEEILKARGLNPSQLSLRAGLGRDHVAKILLRGGGTATLTTIVRLAEASGVTLQWLAKGQGPRDLPTEVDPAERYPNRAAAIALLKGEVSDLALRRVASLHLNAKKDPPRWWWVSRIKQEDDAIALEQDQPELASTQREESERARDRIDEQMRAQMKAAEPANEPKS